MTPYIKTSKPAVALIDCDAENRRLIMSWLSEAGYQSYGYTNLKQFRMDYDQVDHLCVITEMNLPDGHGLDVQRFLHESARGIQAIFVTDCPNINVCVTAMQEGAVDYLTKPADKQRLLNAVGKAIDRHDLVARRLHKRLEARTRLSNLTRREMDVLGLLLRGQSNREIGAGLGTAESTIKIHRRHIMEKTCVHSLPELVMLAQAGGIKVTWPPEKR